MVLKNASETDISLIKSKLIINNSFTASVSSAPCAVQDDVWILILLLSERWVMVIVQPDLCCSVIFFYMLSGGVVGEMNESMLIFFVV